MKFRYSILVLLTGIAVSGVGYANHLSVDPRLDYAASNLVFAANQLVNGVREAQGDSHIEQDAETLYDAAEHFKEEVELGPEDLDVDFNTISQTFREMREELTRSYLVLYNPQVRICWFNTQESWVRLRQAWLSHANPGPFPPPGPGPFPPPGPGPFPPPGPGPGPFPPPGPIAPVTVDCGSSRYQYQQCPVAGRILSVRVTQQLSFAPCIEGRSFGILPNAIWVNRGCRALFLVSTQY